MHTEDKTFAFRACSGRLPRPIATGVMKTVQWVIGDRTDRMQNREEDRLDLTQLKTEARRLLHFDQPAQAAALLQDGMARLGADSEAHGLMGAALSRTGNEPLAVSHFEQAVRLDPSRAANHYNLGVAYEKMGRVDWALEGYRQALVRDPAFEQAITAYYRLAPLAATAQAHEPGFGGATTAVAQAPFTTAPTGFPAPPQPPAVFQGPRDWSAAPHGVRTAYTINVVAIVLGLIGYCLVALGYSQSARASDDNVVIAVMTVIVIVFEAVGFILLAAHKRAWPIGWVLQLIVAIVGLMGIPIYTIMYAVLLMRWFKPDVRAWYGVA
jgi:hypothetical protein